MIRVIDDVLFYADKYREQAVQAKFEEVLGFPGIAKVDGQDWFAKTLAAMAQVPIRIEHSFFRRSPVGQREPNYIHTDQDMGQYTAILYLNYTHPEDDGTYFWKSRETGRLTGTCTSEYGKDVNNFELIRKVPMRFNRAVIFDSRLFHSRGLESNFGTDENARLIQTVFFSL